MQSNSIGDLYLTDYRFDDSKLWEVSTFDEAYSLFISYKYHNLSIDDFKMYVDSKTYFFSNGEKYQFVSELKNGIANFASSDSSKQRNFFVYGIGAILVTFLSFLILNYSFLDIIGVINNISESDSDFLVNSFFIGLFVVVTLSGMYYMLVSTSKSFISKQTLDYNTKNKIDFYELLIKTLN